MKNAFRLLRLRLGSLSCKRVSVSVCVRFLAAGWIVCCWATREPNHSDAWMHTAQPMARPIQQHKRWRKLRPIIVQRHAVSSIFLVRVQRNVRVVCAPLEEAPFNIVCLPFVLKLRASLVRGRSGERDMGACAPINFYCMLDVVYERC